jgi:hypothetical protein
MIIVLTKSLVIVFSWIEKQLTGKHFKSHAGQRPHISRQIVLGSGQNIRTSILSGLNLSGKVMMLPASIT